MKKFGLAMLCVLAAQTIWASDVIFMRSGEEVEAQVLEITQTQIKYKKVSNLNGPVYSVEQSDVFMVKYQNGEKDLFATEQLQRNVQADASIELENPDAALAYGTASFTGLVVNNVDKPVSVDGKAINEQEYLALAQKNCKKAYDQYMSGLKFKKNGNIMLAVGVPVFAVGSIMAIVGAVNMMNDYYPESFSYDNGMSYQTAESLYYSGTIMASVGGTVALGSIPFYIIGKNKRRGSFETYNKAIKEQQSSMALEFQAGYSSLGMALKF